MGYERLLLAENGRELAAKIDWLSLSPPLRVVRRGTSSTRMRGSNLGGFYLPIQVGSRQGFGVALAMSAESVRRTIAQSRNQFRHRGTQNTEEDSINRFERRA